MSVYRKPDGRWFCIYNVPGSKNPAWESFGRGPAAELKARERDVEIKKQKRYGPRLCAADGLLFAELFNKYAEARRIELSIRTVDEIFNTVTLYADPVIGMKPCRQISIDDWTAIQERMASRAITARSINKYFQYLSKIISWGINNLGELRTMPHPWANRAPLRIQKRFRVDLPTIGELRAILAAAPEHLKWVIEVEYHTGMRPGRTELFALQWSDIDLTTGAVSIYSSKTDSHHTQYVSPAFCERIKTRREWYRQEAERLAKRRGKVLPECPYVIQYQGGRVSQVARAWREAKEAAGVKKRIRLYDIRHFYITHALLAGANILDLSNRVGHQGPEMIARVYAHMADGLTEKKPLSIPELIEHSFGNSNDHANTTLDKNIRQDEKRVAAPVATP